MNLATFCRLAGSPLPTRWRFGCPPAAGPSQSAGSKRNADHPQGCARPTLDPAARSSRPFPGSGAVWRPPVRFASIHRSARVSIAPAAISNPPARVTATTAIRQIPDQRPRGLGRSTPRVSRVRSAPPRRTLSDFCSDHCASMAVAKRRPATDRSRWSAQSASLILSIQTATQPSSEQP